MNQHLRPLFVRALADEPEPPGDLAAQAMAIGASLRRRRNRWVVAGAAGVAAIVASVGVNVARPPKHSTPPVTVPAGFAMLLNPACETPARGPATDLSVFLTVETTDQQRREVGRVLDADPAVGALVYESPEEAHVKFKRIFAGEPESVAAVKASQLPGGFRIKLTGRSQYANLAARVERLPGVDGVVASECPAGTSIGADN